MPAPLHRAGLDEDLRPFSAMLWQQRIAHRIVEEDGHQVLLLQSEDDRGRASDLLRRWLSGELRVTLRRRTPVSPGASRRRVAARFPVTLALIAASVLGFLLIYLRGPVSWVALLTYAPFVVEAGYPMFEPATGEPWRFITPVFLHFGWMHIVFNSLWCWELGKRIEGALGSVHMAGLFLVTAAVSNTAQYLVTGPVLFGGLSGVVYGLLGFAWVAGRLNPRWRGLAPSTPIMLFMVGWLLICLLGVIDVLGFSIANSAHVGGLLCGAALGALFAILYRARG